jgi:hypothetical protein
MSQPEQSPIARHEAAHEVVAHLLGARIRKIELSAESQEKGLTNIDRIPAHAVFARVGPTHRRIPKLC